MFHRIRERKPIPFLYCVVLPFWESAVLEIYEYHELLSDLYEEKEVVIVGLAAGKEDALVLVELEKNEPLEMESIPFFEQVDERRYGLARVVFLHFLPAKK